jgi:hypothetical protein
MRDRPVDPSPGDDQTPTIVIVRLSVGTSVVWAATWTEYVLFRATVSPVRRTRIVQSICSGVAITDDWTSLPRQNVPVIVVTREPIGLVAQSGRTKTVIVGLLVPALTVIRPFTWSRRSAAADHVARAGFGVPLTR